MKSLKLSSLIITILMVLISAPLSKAQSFDRPPVNKLVKNKSDKLSGRRRKVRVWEPRSVTKAKRKQAADERKRDREYRAQLKEDRERHLEIQTPEVRERIIQNKKDADANYKTRERAVASRNRKAAKKYR